jgi:hypothetical protein
MTAPITLTALEKPTLAELRRRYEETTDAETRTRYQMLHLSWQEQTSSQIAQIVLRSQDTVVRVLKRFLTGGLDALPVHDLVEADLWDQLPANLADLLAVLPRADLYRAGMRCRWLFIRPLRASGSV